MALLQYDPHEHINSDAWLALDESERMRLVVRYHRRQRIRLPNETVHATIHVIVENQVALGDAFPAKAVLLRLMREGLDRHQAVHAIGSALSNMLFTAMSEENVDGNLNADYVEKLKSLSAESWRKQAL
jgi:HD superfamily phosphodiesterase